MTIKVRGRTTGLTSVPAHWKPPYPDLTVERPLPDEEDATDGKRGYARVPLSLLHDGYQDLGVLIWAQLRLWFDDLSGEATYVGLAAALGQDVGAITTIEHRFSNAIRPLLGTWIHRTRVGPNLFAYQAVLPDPDERYALIRRRDIGLLRASKGSERRVKPADIVDFARWQLECGRRGWTVEPVALIAERWGVTPATVRASRKRLADLGLVEVERREGRGRLPEIVWLKERYDPHWSVPSTPLADNPQQRAVREKTRQSGLEPRSDTSIKSAKKPTVDSEESRQRIGQKTDRPYLSDSLADDLSDLGGTSVPPAELPTREQSDAPPTASSIKDHHREQSPDLHQVSARLVRRYPVFANAKPHFRRAVIARLAAALAGGLEPGHADRALARVADEGAFDAECLLLRRALQQARADQLAGMCADCGGDRNAHRRGCAQFVGAWDDTPLEPTAVAELNLEDPLAILLRRRAPEASELVDDVSTVEWLIQQFALQLMDVSDREARLRAIVVGMRAKARSGQRHLIDQAAEHVRYALTRSMAS